MNNMPALTQEQRATLIEFNKGKLSSLKLAVKQRALEDVHKELEAELLSTQITLAVLTARPAFWVYADSLKTNLYSTPAYPEREDAEERNLGREVIALHSVPPVPELRLLDEVADDVCTTAAGIFGQTDPEKAQVIIDEIRQRLRNCCNAKQEN